MTKFIVSYKVIQPIILSNEIQQSVNNVVPFWDKINDNYFSFGFISWLPMTTMERMIIKNIIKKYI